MVDEVGSHQLLQRGHVSFVLSLDEGSNQTFVLFE